MVRRTMPDATPGGEQLWAPSAGDDDIYDLVVSAAYEDAFPAPSAGPN